MLPPGHVYWGLSLQALRPLRSLHGAAQLVPGHSCRAALQKFTGLAFILQVAQVGVPAF